MRVKSLLKIIRDYQYLLIIGIIAFTMRIPWINIGTSHQYQPDEWVYFTNAFKYFTFQFTNNTMLAPVAFSYLIFVGYIILFPILFILGKVHSFGEFYSSFYTFGDPYLDYANPAFLTTARLVTVIITILFGILIGIYIQKKYSKLVSLISTSLFFILPTEFLYSRFCVPDMALTASMFVSILFIIRFFYNPKLLNWVLACITVIISTSIKLPGTIMFLPLLYALLKNSKYIGIKKLTAFLGTLIFITIIGLVILAPNMVLSISGISLLKGVFNMLQSTDSGIENFRHDMNSSYWSYFNFILFDYGPIIFVVCLIGVSLILKKFKESSIIWLLVLVPFFSIFQYASTKMARFIIPLTTLFFIFSFPSGLEFIINKIRIKKNLSLLLIITLLFAFPIYQIFNYYSIWNQEDTRKSAENWLMNKNYSNKNFAREIHFTSHLPSNYKKPVLEEWALGSYNISDLRDLNINMIMISGSYKNFVPESNTYKNYKSYFDSLKLVAQFDGKNKIIGSNPSIYIFELQTLKN